MLAQTFYFSRILGNKIYDGNDNVIGKLKDIVLDTGYKRPKVIAVKVKSGKSVRFLGFDEWRINKKNGQYKLKCLSIKDVALPEENILFLVKNILDKQIVDVNGRKLVRVNDVRMAVVEQGAFLIAVDVGLDGLLRRIGIAKPLNYLIKHFGLHLPSKFITWEDVETINFLNKDIKLSKEISKLHTLHPSDIADIVEDMDRTTQIAFFGSLNEELAADVLEEMEPDAQVDIIENLSIEKAADVLEKMPADEAADLLDDLKDEKAEALLREMEKEASEEVRELMIYEDKQIGSLMSTDYVAFNENNTVDEVIRELRKLKPETNSIYSLFITDSKERLKATVSLRDLIVSDPKLHLKQIMNRHFPFVYDNDKTKSLAELVSKYNLLAVPVVNKEMILMGTVVVDDVIDELMD